MKITLDNNKKLLYNVVTQQNIVIRGVKMKQIYYITFIGRYENDEGKASRKRLSFSQKDTCTDFKSGDLLIHKGRWFRVEEVIYEPIEGAYC